MSEKRRTKELELNTDLDNQGAIPIKDLNIDKNIESKNNNSKNIEETLGKKDNPKEDLFNNKENSNNTNKEKDNLASNKTKKDKEAEEKPEIILDIDKEEEKNKKDKKEISKPNNYKDIDKEFEKDEKKKKIIKISVIAFIVALLITGIIVGSLAIAGVGVFGSEDNGAGFWNFDDLNKWIESSETKQTKITNTENILKDRATIYAYDTLGKDGRLLMTPSESKDAKERALRNANHKIDTQKEDLRKSEGKNWEDEWDKELVGMGFSIASQGGEDQYRDSLVNDSLQNSILEAFSGSSHLTAATKQVNKNEGYEFSSSNLGSDTSEKYRVIKKGDANNEVNIESLLDFYIKYNKPINFDEGIIPFRITDFDKTHKIINLEDKDIQSKHPLTFASSEDLTKLFYLSDAFSKDKLDKGFEKILNPTNSGIVKLNNLEITTPEPDPGPTPELSHSSYEITNDDPAPDPGPTVDTNETEVLLLDALMSKDTLSGDTGDLKNFFNKELEKLSKASDIETLKEDNPELFKTFEGDSYKVLEKFANSTDSGKAKIAFTEIDSIAKNKFIIGFETDGLHLLRMNGFNSEDEKNNYKEEYSQNLVKHDLDVAFKAPDVSKEENLYGIWSDFNTWINDNYEFLILNSAYEEGINLISNPEYPDWTDVITENEITMQDLEEQLYRTTSLEMFTNFFNKKMEYKNFIKKYGDKEEFTSPLDLTKDSSEYTFLKNVVYSENGFSSEEKWNKFMINYKDGVGDLYGAIQIFTSETKYYSKGGNKYEKNN